MEFDEGGQLPNFDEPFEQLRDIQQEIVQEIQEKLHYEILAAWRLGYDFLHEFHPIVPTTHYEDEDRFTVGFKVQKSNRKKPPSYEVGNWKHARTFDLRDLTRAQVREAKHQT